MHCVCRGWWLPTVLMAVAVAPRAAAQPPRSPVIASLAPWQDQRLQDAAHPGHLFRSRDASLDTGAVRYVVKYCACVDPAHGDEVVPIEGYIGMPAPSAANWYHSGFLFVIINGQDIGRARLSSMVVAESGTRGILDMVWHHSLADVRVRFLALPQDDKLLVEVALDPKVEVQSLVLRTTCYPSYFTSWNHRDGARRVQTPSSLVRQGETTTLPAADNWWGVYYDEVFDVAKGEGDGPCGMLVLPEEAQELTVQATDYPVNTTISYRPQLRRLHLAFWDWTGHPNAEVLAAMPAAAERARAALQETDFTPATLREFDFAGARREVEQALASEAVRSQLGERLGQMQDWLAACEPLFAQPAVEQSIAGEERFLSAVGEYQQFSWEVKLAELLSTL